MKSWGGEPLHVGDATSLPIASMSADLVLASFVASYVAECRGLPHELRRVARAYSDLHLRSSSGNARSVQLEAWLSQRTGRVGLDDLRPLPEVIASSGAAGFEVSASWSRHSVAEREIFRSAGKLESFYAAAGLPAIYILQLNWPKRGRAYR